MFEKFIFTERQIQNYYQAALKDFSIASKSDVPEVVFKFCYDSLLKLAIAVCAKNNLRVKARQGHHIKLIDQLAVFLNNSDIGIIGDEMRSKRNWDLYSGGILISEKEAADYLQWVKTIFQQADNHFSRNLKLF